MIDQRTKARLAVSEFQSALRTKFEAEGRVANGVAHRVDRLRALGNGQVPAVAALAWRMLSADPSGYPDN